MLLPSMSVERFSGAIFGGLIPRTLQAYRISSRSGFAGVHCDVGGGYEEKHSGLSTIALQWMLKEAESKGLLVYQTAKESCVSTGPGIASSPARSFQLTVHHPDRQTVARMLKEFEATDKTLYFNYRQPRTELWDSLTLERCWSYNCVFPVTAQGNRPMDG